MSNNFLLYVLSLSLSLISKICKYSAPHRRFGRGKYKINIFFMINLQVMFERIRVENEERKGQESSRVEPGKEGEPTTGASDPQVMGRLDQETVNNQILELNEMLKKLNAYSSFLNILTLMVLKLHLVYVAHRLYMTC